MPIFVNDRFEVALSAGAHGVHLGVEDLAPDAAVGARTGGVLVGASLVADEAQRASRSRTGASVRCMPLSPRVRGQPSAWKSARLAWPSRWSPRVVIVACSPKMLYRRARRVCRCGAAAGCSAPRMSSLRLVLLEIRDASTR